MSADLVHLVDDDDSFLRATGRMLRASGYAVCLHSSAALFVSRAKLEGTGCVVADLEMPGMDGMALQAHLRERGASLPVVFLTAHGDIPTSVRAMKAGAEDFLMKCAPRTELVGAIDRALQRSRREKAKREKARELRARFDSLSPREVEVLGHVVRGRLNKQIAAELGIHERTVKFHRASITRKLDVRSSAELATLVTAARLLD